jgi:GntR family carbon starvation induced transcriptional regulator
MAGTRAPGRDEGSEGTFATMAHRLIRDDILSGSLQPGARLRPNELQDRYKIGLAPIREALTRLMAEDLVNSQDHKGFWVSPLSVEDLTDLTRVRMLLEGEALRGSIERGGDLWEAELLSSYHRLAKSTSRGEMFRQETLKDWEAVHEQFHEALIGAAGSRLLMRLRAQFSQLVRRYRVYALLNPGERDLNGEHKAIMEAALDHDAPAAIALLADHYDQTTQIILANFKDPL